MNPLNFFLNPNQLAEVRRDQYFPAMPSGVGGTWGLTQQDYRGNSYNLAPADNQILVQIIANDDDEIKDSNNYYLCKKIDQWFGVSGGDIDCEMRLQSDADLNEGDEVFGVISGIVSESPNPDDDGAHLVKEIIVAQQSSDHFWAEIIGQARNCNGDDVTTGYRWRPASPLPCCGWDDSADEVSVNGTLAEVAIISSGDGISTPASWDVSFTRPPTFGTWLISLDGVPYAPLQWDISAADLQAMLPDVAVSLTAGVYSITSDNYDSRSLVAVSLTLEPLSQNLACEINGLNLGGSFHVMMWKGVGGDAKIKIEKTDAVPTGDDASGVIWVVTLENTIGGSFTLAMDEFDPTDDTRWDAAAASLETNINEKISPATVTVTADADGGPFTITVTSDFLDHDLTKDVSELFGNKTYLFWPDVNSGGPSDEWTPIFVNDASSPYLASHKQLVLCSTIVGDLVVLLPNPAGTGTQVRVVVSEPDLGGGAVTVDPNGSTIQTDPTPYSMSARYVVKEFVMGNPAEGSGNWLICG